MFPALNNCRVRGCKDDFYLQNYKTGEEFVLDSVQANVLYECNGVLSVEAIANRLVIPKEDLQIFLSGFEDNGLLVLGPEPTNQSFGKLGTSPILREVHCDITGNCNLFGVCKHCYGRASFQADGNEDLSLEAVESLVNQMSAMNVADCVLSGGEPFCRKDLPEIIGLLDDKAVHITGIFTNGTIERSDVFEALSSRQIKTFFFVSLDGASARVNDFMRGPGSFAKTILFIKSAIAAGFPVVVNTMVIKQNVDHLHSMRVYLEQLGVHTWRLSTPREQGEAIVNSELIMPEWSKVFRSYQSLISHSLSSTDRMKIQIGSIFRTDMLRDKVYYLFSPSSSCCEYKRWSIVVKPNGNIVPCSAFDNMVFGNIRENRLEDVWFSESVQAFKNLPVSKTDCKECKLLGICGSGCRKIAYELCGSVFAKGGQSCPLYEFARDVVLPMLEGEGVVAKKLRKPVPFKYDIRRIEECIRK